MGIFLGKLSCLGVVAFLTVSAILPTALPASAAASSVTTFVDGADSRTVAVGFLPDRAFAGTLRLPSHANINAASLSLEGHGRLVTTLTTDGGSAGFSAGYDGTDVTVDAGGITLAKRTGAVTFAGPALDAGTFAGTTRGSAGVAASATGGTYLSPAIAFDGASYGHLFALAEVPPGSALMFDVEAEGGPTLLTGIKPGDLIAPTQLPSGAIKVLAHFVLNMYGQSPLLVEVGVGHAIEDGGLGAPVHQTTEGALWAPGSVQLAQGGAPFDEAPSNPILRGAAGTYWQSGLALGSALTFGSQIWLYFESSDAVDETHIGRATSDDGGASWTVDAVPLMNETGAGWESVSIHHPMVLDTGSGLMMWFTGFSGSTWSIGVATSPDGITWTRNPGNPVLTTNVSGWDNGEGVFRGSVVRLGATYFMYYTGRTMASTVKSIGVATSTDGLNWTKYAGNPVIQGGSYAPASFEAWGGGQPYLEGGVVYLPWTCASGPTSYDICLSSSTDGFTFVHDGRNPIITAGDGAWDATTTNDPVRVVDPATGVARILYDARDGAPPPLSLGMALEGRLSAGTVSTTWAIGPDPPLRFTSLVANAALPNGTWLDASLEVSPDNVTFSAPEALNLNDSSIVTPPARFVRMTFHFSSSNASRTPELRGWRLEFSEFVRNGSWRSALFAQPGTMQSAALSVVHTTPLATGSYVYVSNDGGSAWQNATAIASGFPANGSALRVRFDLEGTASAAPVISAYSATLGIFSLPRDVTLRLADGRLIASVPGDLGAATVVPLQTDELAILALSAPPAGVFFDVYVASATPGNVTISGIDIALVVADQGGTAPAPAGDFGPLSIVLLLVLAAVAAAAVIDATRSRRRLRDAPAPKPPGAQQPPSAP